MKEKTDKILTLVLLGLSIVASILAVLFALGSDPKHIMQGITELGNSNSVAFDIAFWMLVILIGVALCAIVVFLCKKLFARFREEKGYLKKFLILVIVIVALLVVSFLLANGNDVSLRYAAANRQYSAMMQSWIDGAEVVWNEGFETPDMAAIFG